MLLTTARGAVDYALQTGANRFFRTELSSSLYTGNETLTIEFWVKPEGAGVLLAETDAFDPTRWDFSLLEVAENGELRFSLPGISGVGVVGNVQFGKWQHVALRYDHSEFNVTAFLDGIQGQTLLGNRRTAQEASRDAYFTFGRAALAHLAGGRALNGVFDEIRFWRVGRTAQEIQAGRVAGDPEPTGLAANWHIDEGSGSRVVDATGQGRHGLTVGAVWLVSDLNVLLKAPEIESLTAIVDRNAVTFNATVNPSGLDTQVYFEYFRGTNIFRTSLTNLSAGRVATPVATTVNNLPSGSYSYRAVAENARGINRGVEQTFTISTISGLGARLPGGNSYLRSGQLANTYFTNETMTLEIWFNAETPGVLANEVDNFSHSAWDKSVIEILPGGQLVAAIPGLPTVNLGTISFGEWTHVAIRYDESTRTFDGFLNGIKTGTATGNRTSPWEASRNVYWTFGRGGPKNLGPGGSLRGVVDEIRMWRTARTDQEIATSYNVVLPSNNNDLFGYWRFEAMTQSGTDGFPSAVGSSPNNNTILFVFFSGDLRVPTSVPLLTISGMGGRLEGGNAYLRSGRLANGYFTNKTLTLEMWFNAEAPGVLANEVDNATHSAWDHNVIEILPGGQLVATIPGLSTVTLGTISFGSWTHVAIRYDESTRTFDGFLNGAKVGTATGNRTAPWENQRYVYWTFGRGGSVNLAPPAPSLKGVVDEIRMWRTARTDEEIANNYDLLLSPNNPDLFGYWRFEAMTPGGTDGWPSAVGSTPNNNTILFVRYGGDFRVPADLPLRANRPLIAETGVVSDFHGPTTVLKGRVENPETQASVWFIWGQERLDRRTATQVIPATNGVVMIEALVSPLEPGKSYQYALVASNSVGVVSTGATRVFTKLGWGGYALTSTENSHFRTVSDQERYFTNESLTIELWIKPTKAGVIVGESDRFTSPTLDSSLMEVLPNGNVIAGLPGVPAILLGEIELEAWNHVVLRYDHRTFLLDGFVNGVKAGSSSVGNRITPKELNRTAYFSFGKAMRDSLATGESLPAEWEEVRIWDHARMDHEVIRDQSRRLVGTDPGLILYYRFDEISSVIQDASQYDNDGVFVGTSQEFVISAAPIVMKHDAASRDQNGDMVVSFLALPGRQFTLETSSDLTSWTEFSTILAEQNGIANFNVGNVRTGIRFFRGKQL